MRIKINLSFGNEDLYSDSGFTMIELLMVMVIVGSLSSSALPSLLDFRTDAKKAAATYALQNMRQAWKTQIIHMRLRCSRMPVYSSIATAFGLNDITTVDTLCGGALSAANSRFMNDRTLPVNPFNNMYAVSIVNLPGCSACGCSGSSSAPSTMAASNYGWVINVGSPHTLDSLGLWANTSTDSACSL